MHLGALLGTLKYDKHFFSVSNTGQGDRVPLLSHQRGRYVLHIPTFEERGRLHGVAFQQNLPLLLHLPLRIHGAQPVHRSHH